jgi:hypothetical protein
MRSRSKTMIALRNHSRLATRTRLLLAGCGMLMIPLHAGSVNAQEWKEGCVDTFCGTLRGKVEDDSGVSRDVRIAPNVEQEENSTDGGVPFSISVDGEPLVGARPPALSASAGGPRTTNAQRKTDMALSGVDIQVKFDGLEVKPVLNVMTNPVRKSYRAGDEVRFLATSNYPAFIERSEIRVFERGERLEDRPVAVMPVDINGEAGWAMPQTRNDESRFEYVLRVYDADGRYDETLPRSLARTDREIPREDLQKIEGTAPGMGDDNTGLRNIPIYGGAVTVFGRHVPPGYQIRALDEMIPVDQDQAFVVQRILPGGDHNVDVAVLGSLKGSALEFNRQINIPKNDWFYVALADLTVGKRTGDANIETVRQGEYDKVYTKGRLAFYLKGKIKGEYLLTAAADTGEDKLENLFRGLDAKDPRNLLRRIDPDDYYPIYGDDSTTIDDAPTSGKFYVRLERGDSHVMWGDYKAVIKGTEFMHSERALYGASAVYRSENATSFGERKTEVTLYAAQPDTLPQRDEFLGTGGSAYFLKRQDISVGSETVVIEVRDDITGQVKERRTLQYGEDYSFDYLQGVIILKRPLSSSTGTTGPVRDGALGGNKVYLIAQYEYTPTVGEVDGYVYGGRAQHWLNEKVRVGVTGMNENTGLANQQAFGADIQVRHSETTFIEAEVSHSQGPGFGTSRSTDGGLTLSDVGTSGLRDRAALAWRTRAQIDLEDIPNSGMKGKAGVHYQEKQAGFSTLADQIYADQRIWGAFADIDVTDDVNLKLEYDDFKEDETPRDLADDFPVGGREKRKGSSWVTKQFDDYWKFAFGVSYMEVNNPLARAANKSGYDGSRLDVGARLDYSPDADHNYYLFGQATVDRSGDIERGDRVGVGTKYQLTDAIGLEGEISYGATGLGALAGVTYNPDPDATYYFGYRLDPDRAFDVNRTYDLTGVDKGSIVLGARRKFDEYWSTYAENNWDLFGDRRSLTKTYGVVYTPDTYWTFDGGFEAGTINDETLDSNGVQRADFDRKAVSLAVGYKDDDRITASLRGEARFEDSEDDTRDVDTYLVSGGLNIKTSDDWRMLLKLDSVISDSKSEASFRDDKYTEATVGFAYRPATNDRFNALFKYSWLYDAPGMNQVSAVSGDEYGPSQRSHILSADFTYDLLPWLSVGGKYGFRHGTVRYRELDGDRQQFSDWQKSSAHLGIVRADLHIVKKWDLLLEGRVLAMPEADTVDFGALAAVYRHVGNNFKVGVGYNFGRFSDDLRDLTLDDGGVFLNVIGKF